MVSPIRYRGYCGTRSVFPPAPVPSRRHSHPLPKPRPKVLKSPNKSPRSPRSPSSPSSRSPALSPTDEDSASDINAIHYEIHVITGDVMWAGTDANVYITLCGTDGETGKKQLTKKYTNLFERGRTDCFDLKVKQDLGKLTLLHIEEDETGFGAAWLLERVEVINMSTNKKTMFLCGEWLDHEHGTDRYLLPEQDPDKSAEGGSAHPQPIIEVTEPQDETESPAAPPEDNETIPAEDSEGAPKDNETIPAGDSEGAPKDNETIPAEDSEGAPDDGNGNPENTENVEDSGAQGQASEPTDDDKAPLVSTDSL